MNNQYIKKTYVTKRRTKEAVRWNGENIDQVLSLKGKSNLLFSDISSSILIDTLEGTIAVNIGDFIIKGLEDELYPCKETIFLNTYEVYKGGEKTC